MKDPSRPGRFWKLGVEVVGNGYYEPAEDWVVAPALHRAWWKLEDLIRWRAWNDYSLMKPDKRYWKRY